MKTIIENNKKINHGKTVAGVIILIAGSLLLIDAFHLFFIPNWLFSWPMWVIAWGAYLAGKHNFRSSSPVIIMLLGVAFLLTENIDNADIIVWPVAIMAAGIWIVFKNSRKISTGYSGR